MAVIVLSALAVFSGGVALAAEAKRPRRLFYVFKPLTMILIIGVAASSRAPAAAGYKWFILAGLACSLAGDVFLMLPGRWFAAGLVSFLAAHGFYILAFKPGQGRAVSAGILLPFVIFGLLMFRLLAPSLGGLKLPVFVYIAAITAMAWLAADRFISLGGAGPLLAFAGAILFLVSDSVLAYNKFAGKIGPAQTIILGTYFPAQLLIALSV
jgi:uncharacterized membrane protein YhhN